MVIPSFYLTDGDSSPPAPRNHLAPQANGSPAQVSGASEIVPNLFLGDLQDARRFDGMIISVLPDPMEDEPTRTIRLPFLANGRASLDTTAAVIDAALSRGLRVLVHCEGLTDPAGMTLEQAYRVLISRRPIVRDRRLWLGIYNR